MDAICWQEVILLIYHRFVAEQKIASTSELEQNKYSPPHLANVVLIGEVLNAIEVDSENGHGCVILIQ